MHKTIKPKINYTILMLLCAATVPAYAKNESSVNNPVQKAQYENQFHAEIFAKCNVCHKPLESTMIGSRLIPSYLDISHMEQSAIEQGIEHGGNISSGDKSKIYSAIRIANNTVKTNNTSNTNPKSSKSKNNVTPRTHARLVKHRVSGTGAHSGSKHHHHAHSSSHTI